MANIKSRRHTDLYYVKGIIYDEEIIIPVMDMVTIPIDGIKLYGSVFFRLSQATPCATLLYYWSVMEMSNSMIVATDEFSRNRFNSYAKKLNFDYHDVTIKKAIAELIRLELFIRIARSRCKVSPEFCFTGKEQDRTAQIKLHIARKEILIDYELSKDKNEVQRKVSKN